MTKSNKKSIPVKALSTAALLGTISVVGATHHADAATGEKPTIQAPDQQVKYGTTWNPYQNVTAHDKEDGDLTNEIYYEAPYFETTNPGDYNVRYGVYDFDDNLTEVDRNVRVLKEGVEPVNPKPTPPQPEQPSDVEKPDNTNPSDKPAGNEEQPNESTPEQPSDNNPSDVEKPDNTNPSDEPTGNEEQPNKTTPSESTPEQLDNTNPSDEPTNSESPSETSKESKPSNTTSKQPDTNEPSNVDAPKLTESPKATTVHNQPGSTQPVSSNTTSEQPNVEKESNNNTQRLTESPKTTTVNNTLGSTQVEPTPVSTNVTTNNISDVISPEKVETKHELDHSGMHDNTPIHTKTTISDNYTTTQPTMNPSDDDFNKSTVVSKEDVRNNNNEETLPETGGTDSSREAGVIVSLFAGLLAFVGLRRKKENN
ncbi:immunoglobulin-like domain-containing protein [Staphylococcus hominis]|uniref:immunoglobulin-like domain-containing protein n=3 Tax=Staphylococcus hominis TaxID=1290 RepID=UPI0012DE0DED|nr:immunoglobulin-like domain-containing protein [Staphylococcus hominis]MCI2847738.1 DUF5011 domain-containing protein [Staphylococcus hominis]MCI2849775.1 DUF5011 domain-containing protein [Staphylococcus hominis]MCI2856519.1 DUF5011 domain-containing protein [Staphylococcus hominis]MCI2886914.1 DUF5011 domain-containing protein [Staphylococcus hominis]MDS3852150.1 DUF5011 domain-containing protein [Staphylococcus hominis]